MYCTWLYLSAHILYILHLLLPILCVCECECVFVFDSLIVHACAKKHGTIYFKNVGGFSSVVALQLHKLETQV